MSPTPTNAARDGAISRRDQATDAWLWTERGVAVLSWRISQPANVTPATQTAIARFMLLRSLLPLLLVAAHGSAADDPIAKVITHPGAEYADTARSKASSGTKAKATQARKKRHTAMERVAPR